jgi:SRSO17 transposase
VPELASVAGAQVAAEGAFQIARQWAGLDQYQVRSVEAWYRHVTLAMLAHTCLASAVLTAEAGNSTEAVSAM